MHAMAMQDFLQRCRSGRFPSIEEDVKIVLAHCGSLQLDPAVLLKVRAWLLASTSLAPPMGAMKDSMRLSLPSC